MRKDKRIVRKKVFALCSQNCCLLLVSCRTDDHKIPTSHGSHGILGIHGRGQWGLCHKGGDCKGGLPVSQLERQSDKHGHKYKICTCACVAVR